MISPHYHICNPGPTIAYVIESYSWQTSESSYEKSWFVSIVILILFLPSFIIIIIIIIIIITVTIFAISIIMMIIFIIETKLLADYRIRISITSYYTT